MADRDVVIGTAAVIPHGPAEMELKLASGDAG
jgi:hypothetical protein